MAEVETVLSELPGPAQIIVADPPWLYGQRWETRKDGSGKNTYGPGASGRYSVMSTEEIMAIPVET